MTDASDQGKDEHQDTGYQGTPPKQEPPSSNRKDEDNTEKLLRVQTEKDVAESLQTNRAAFENGSLDPEEDTENSSEKAKRKALSFLDEVVTGPPTIKQDMGGIDQMGQASQPNNQQLAEIHRDPGQTLIHDMREVGGEFITEGDASSEIQSDYLEEIPLGGELDFDPDKLLGKKFIGDAYVLDDKLGRGGEGIVYLAYNVNLGGFRAIKFMLKIYDPSAKKRFVREATAMKEGSAKNVATLDELFYLNVPVIITSPEGVRTKHPKKYPVPYFKMELLDHDLEDRISREKDEWWNTKEVQLKGFQKYSSWVGRALKRIKRALYLPNRLPSPDVTEGVEWDVELLRVLAGEQGLHKVHNTVISKQGTKKGLVHRDIKPANICFRPPDFPMEPQRGKWEDRYLEVVRPDEIPKRSTSERIKRLGRVISDAGHKALGHLESESPESKTIAQKIKYWLLYIPAKIISKVTKGNKQDKESDQPEQKQKRTFKIIKDEDAQWEVRKVKFKDLAEKAVLTDLGMVKESEMKKYDEKRVKDDDEENQKYLGTPDYFAPEQARLHNSEINAQTDIFQCGVVLYKLLTGNLPLPSHPKNVLEIIIWHTEEKRYTVIKRPHKENKNVDRELSKIVLKMLKYDPNERHESALELSQDLDNWLHNRPTTVSGWYSRPIKWFQRSSKKLAIGAILVTALASPFIYFANRYFEQKGEARDQVQLAIDDYKKFIEGPPPEYQELIEQLQLAKSADESYLEGTHTTQFAQALDRLTKGKQQAVWKIKSDAMLKTIDSVSTSYEAWLESDSTDVATLGTLIEELDPLSSQKIGDFEEGNTQARGFLRQAKRLTEELQDTKLKTERRSRISENRKKIKNIWDKYSNFESISLHYRIV